MKILEINYNQVMDIHLQYNSIEEFYEHYAKNIIVMECPKDLDVRRCWGYIDGEFIKPEAEGHKYVALDNEVDFMLVPEDMKVQKWQDDIKKGMLDGDEYLRNYAREEHLLVLMEEGVI